MATYENFGTSFVYGILRNLCYFVPDRLSYQEISPRSLRYKSLDELVQKVIKALSDQEYAHSLHDEGTSLLHNKFGLPSFLRNAGFIDE